MSWSIAVVNGFIALLLFFLGLASIKKGIWKDKLDIEFWQDFFVTLALATALLLITVLKEIILDQGGLANLLMLINVGVWVMVIVNMVWGYVFANKVIFLFMDNIAKKKKKKEERIDFD